MKKAIIIVKCKKELSSCRPHFRYERKLRAEVGWPMKCWTESNVGILNLYMFIYHYLFTLVLKSPNGEWPIRYTYIHTYIHTMLSEPIPGHPCPLQAAVSFCCEDPGQFLPPFLGAGLEQVRLLYL